MANQIVITGNIGTPPEMRYTASQMAVIEFSVAVTSGKDDKKKTTWHNCKAFGKLAENIVSSVNKGDNVIVVGRIEQDEYTKKDGTKGKSTQLVVDELGMSCRWTAWVKDRTEQVLAQAGISFASPVSDEEEF
jgi:single-strand DNA-binding protein